MSLEELDTICHKNRRLKEEVELIKDYIKKARMDFGDLIDIDHMSSFTGREKHELEQIFTLGSKYGLFEVIPVYSCNGYSIGEVREDIPPFEIFCDICGENHVIREENIKNCYKILFKSELKKKEITNKKDVVEKEINIDFGIITAIKPELNAVKKLINLERVDVGVRTYYIGSVNSDSKSYNIIVVKSPKAGSNDSAAVTADLIRDWDPNFIIKIGIAGGYKRDVKLGDVVISEQIFVYDYTKELDNISKIRPEVFRSDFKLINLIDNFEWNNDGLNESKHIIAPIATGNKLIRSEKIWHDIRENVHDKICALEMEGGGIATVAYQQKVPKGVLIISGISDYGDCDKDNNWHDYSSNIAAKFFFDFIKNNSSL